MKKLIIAALFFLPLLASAQFTGVNGRYYIKNSAKHYQFGSIRTDSVLWMPTVIATYGTGSGSVYVNVTDSSIYALIGATWVKQKVAGAGGGGIQSDTSLSINNRINDTANAIRATINSLGGGIPTDTSVSIQNRFNLKANIASPSFTGNAMFGTTSNLGTATPLNVSFGGTYGTNGVGNVGNVKWKLYDDGTSSHTLGIGMSSSLMEFYGGLGSGFAFFPNGSTEAMRIASTNQVGIGTSTPKRAMNVHVSSGNLSVSFTSLSAASVGTNISQYFGYSDSTYQKGAIVYRTTASAGRGEFRFALENTTGTTNAQYYDAVMTINYLGQVGVLTVSPNSSFHVNGSIATNYTATATGITLDATHNTVNVTATGQTITLPTAVGITGREYTIKLTASGTGTVGTTSSQTIDGSTTYSLSAQYKYVTVKSDGANWMIIANN